jgi:hypothetical protein
MARARRRQRRRQPLAALVLGGGLALLATAAAAATTTSSTKHPNPTSTSSCPRGCDFLKPAQLQRVGVAAAVDFLVDEDGNWDCNIASATKGTKWLCQVNNKPQTLWLALSCPNDVEDDQATPPLRVVTSPVCGSNALSTNVLSKNVVGGGVAALCSLDVKNPAVPSTQRFFITADCAVDFGGGGGGGGPEGQPPTLGLGSTILLKPAAAALELRSSPDVKGMDEEELAAFFQGL